MFILPLVSYSVYAERRISAMIQDRLGPNRVGFAGLLQPLPDALKFMFKEDFTPAHVHKVYFWIAPALAMIPALLTVAVIPFGSMITSGDVTLFGRTFHVPEIGLVVANFDVGVLFVFAIASLSVYGIVIGGWASNSKYPFLGGIRSSAQMISYELAMGLSAIPVFLIAQSLNLSQIVQYQAEHGWSVLPFFVQSMSAFDWRSFVLWVPMLVSFLIFLIASFAETNRLPFDLPESETELVGGYHTEYSSMKFALFFLGEYAAMIVVSALMVTLFFGGWHFPFLPASTLGMETVTSIKYSILHVATFSIKLVLFLILFIWVRWTLPRFRYDQLMHLGWKILLPLALGNIFLTAVLLVLVGKG